MFMETLSRGRPPKEPDKRKSAELRIRLTEQERAELDEAAGANTSTWARDVLAEGRAKALAERPGGIEPRQHCCSLRSLIRQLRRQDAGRSPMGSGRLNGGKEGLHADNDI